MNQFPLLATGGYFLFFICLYYLDSQLFSELRSESNIDLFNYFELRSGGLLTQPLDCFNYSELRSEKY